MSITPEGFTETTITARGPGADTAVAAGTVATISLSYVMEKINKVVDVVGIVSISGLPNGVVVNEVVADVGGVSIKVFNASGADVTIVANSVTVKVKVLGY